VKILHSCVTYLFVVVRLPNVSVDADSGDINVDADHTAALKMHNLPIAATFAIFNEYDTVALRALKS